MQFSIKILTPLIIKKSTNNKCWRGYGKKETLIHCGEAVTMENSLEVP